MPRPSSYRHFKATRQFRKSFVKLSASQRQRAKEKFMVFKTDPFDQRLRTHKINVLSARAGTTVYSVVIESDLRAVFRVDGDTVTTLDIGSHDVYR